MEEESMLADIAFSSLFKAICCKNDEARNEEGQKNRPTSRIMVAMFSKVFPFEYGFPCVQVVVSFGFLSA